MSAIKGGWIKTYVRAECLWRETVLEWNDGDPKGEVCKPEESLFHYYSPNKIIVLTLRCS